MGLDLRYEYQKLVKDSKNPPDFKKLFTFKINFQYDSRDKAFIPTEGVLLSTYLESNLVPSSDFISYSKIYFAYSQTASFQSRHSLSWGFEVGAGDETMPETEMFSLGGENNFWGMREDQSRGRQILNTTLYYNYRVPVKNFFDINFSLILNSGRTWLKPETIKLSSFREGIGARFSIDTPLGPFSLSMGKSFFISQKQIIWSSLLGYLSIGVNL
ncbi:MAG: hypothetical protein A2X64_00820 [Ignavibacteria bacterium GWF2_33_9]|nr:MAG: hypothetical protein A2X64_00820 [Ignavibacteria bacterium GWF2_33_9]